MKIVSFNVNGIRTREHQLKKLIELHNPDIIGLQEIKVRDEEFPVEMINDMGYHIEYFGQKTHYGVGIMSKNKPLSVQKGYPWDNEDSQRRIITCKFETSSGETITVINGYFPQGESRDHPVKFPAKEKFYKDLIKYLNENFKPEENIIVIGDMNISPEDKDIGIGEDNRKRWLRTGKCSFLPEEREWMKTLLEWGFVDTYRKIHPDKADKFSWFDYRSKGFDKEPKRGLRIDLLLATEKLASKCTDSGIDYEIRGMERPSDHCPVWSEFDI